jgi:hypothetical protein
MSFGPHTIRYGRIVLRQETTIFISAFMQEIRFIAVEIGGVTEFSRRLVAILMRPIDAKSVCGVDLSAIAFALSDQMQALIAGMRRSCSADSIG